MNSARDMAGQARGADPVRSEPLDINAASSSAASDSTPVKARWTASVGLAPVVLALLTAMFYLNGRAYFLGYLDYFHLEPTMFSDDLSNQVTRSVMAWLHATMNFATWYRAQFRWTTAALLLAPIAFLVVLCLAAALFRGLVSLVIRAFRWLPRRTAKMRKHPGLLVMARWIGKTFTPPPFVKAFMSGLGTVYLAGYIGCVLVWVVSLILIVLVLPFGAVGKSVAAKDAAEQFATSPMAVVKDAHGNETTYRIILCAPRYCALYDGKRALTVSASEIGRAESPDAGSSPKSTK